jgi:hypothetical protein
MLPFWKPIVDKKIIFAFMLGVAIGAFFHYNFLSDNSFYHERLASECINTAEPECCRLSVEIMSKGNFKLSGGGCPQNYRENMLDCISSFEWCEPAR